MDVVSLIKVLPYVFKGLLYGGVPPYVMIITENEQYISKGSVDNLRYYKNICSFRWLNRVCIL